MRVKTWVETAQEIEVEVNIAEVMSTIAGLAETDQVPMACDCINTAYNAIKSLPDSVIEKMNEDQRRVIANALRVQTIRFET